MQQVTVVGAGVVGLCSAVFLQQAGFDVLLMDANPPGSGCSKGNAGHFATEQVFPLADASLLTKIPAMLLNPAGPLRIRASYLLNGLPWFGRFIANMRPAKRQAHQQALSQLNHASLCSWQKLATLCQADDLLVFKGALLVSEQTSAKLLQQTYRQYRNAGIDLRLLSASQLQQLEPALQPNLSGALDFTEVAHTVEPYLLSQRLFQHFTALGGRWRQSEIHQIIAGKHSHQLVTAQGNVDTGQLIIAAGAGSHLLTRQLGWPVPLTAERGYHLMVNPVPLQRPVSSLERKFIMTPMQHGLRLAGTVEFAGLTAKADYRRARALLSHATALLQPALTEQAGDSCWYGNRPSLPDSLPVLGDCPRHKGIYYNFGHQHLGLTQAAFCAELLTSRLLQQQPAIDLTPFRISRF